jgi:hypothetical protein
MSTPVGSTFTARLVVYDVRKPEGSLLSIE